MNEECVPMQRPRIVVSVDRIDRAVGKVETITDRIAAIRRDNFGSPPSKSVGVEIGAESAQPSPESALGLLENKIAMLEKVLDSLEDEAQKLSAVL